MRRLVVVCILLLFAAVAAQAATWDLASDWTISTSSGKAIFGADDAWGGYWGGVAYYDRPASYTSGSPLYDPWGDEDLYNIDAWSASSAGTDAWRSTVGKNMGGGSVPDYTGIEYDWPAGTVAGINPKQKYRSQPYFWWKAPEDGTANVSGSYWNAAYYGDMTNRRVVVTLSLDKLENGPNLWGGDPLGFSRGKLLPLRSDGYDSANPYTFATMYGGDAGFLQNLSLKKGDLLIAYAYQENDLFAGAITGLNFTVDFTPIPEPGAFASLSVGLVGLVGFARRRRTRK